jgi:hypothetical protein
MTMALQPFFHPLAKDCHVSHPEGKKKNDEDNNKSTPFFFFLAYMWISNLTRPPLRVKHRSTLMKTPYFDCLS